MGLFVFPSQLLSPRRPSKFSADKIQSHHPRKRENATRIPYLLPIALTSCLLHFYTSYDATPASENDWTLRSNSDDVMMCREHTPLRGGGTTHPEKAGLNSFANINSKVNTCHTGTFQYGMRMLTYTLKTFHQTATSVHYILLKHELH